MDYIEKLANQASQITMYDVKTYYNQAKNAVLNLSEMEAKVREATNDDPWGASSTLMQQIADGAQFNEIMPTIYSRFMEKEAREWRQIYKALTLLEFLVKNGSERVVDDARAHVSTIKMLRSFHYIDEKGKDQGINVRNRASEIASLLGDIDKIRQERRKAKANKTKYGGQGNDGGMSFTTASGGRYGGFGSDSLGSGGGGGGGGSSGGGYRGGGDYDSGDDYRRRPSPSNAAAAEYDEYEGADDFEEPRRTGSSSTNRTSRPQPPPKSTTKPAKPVEKPKEVNLFDFGDDEPAAAPAAAASGSQNILGGDDDFDDFQSAPSGTTSAAAPKPAAAPASSGNNANLFDLLNSGSTAKPAAAAPPSYGSAMPAMGAGFTSPPAASPGLGMPSLAPAAPTSRPSYTSPPVAGASSALSPKATGGPSKASNFDDLFASSLTSMGGSANGNAQKPGTKSMKDLEQEKAMNKLWGPSPGSQAPKTSGSSGPAKPSGGGGFDDLLM